jgi:hypothetical protein
MDILNKPITSFTFDDVVSFCRQGHREGIQIDYKRDIPANGLSKFFAAFSNTRGGIIIIGVEENRQTGVPIAWDGIDNNAQTIERIHQWASNVEPIPEYIVHPTNEIGGKIFVLIRVFEGDKTPYYVQNEPNIFVRTGSITPSIDLASPDAVELLFKKKEKAELSRKNYLNKAVEIYKICLSKDEKERKRLIMVENEEHIRRMNNPVIDERPTGKFQTKYYQKELGLECVLCKVTVLPFYPHKAIVTPQEIKSKIATFTTKVPHDQYPEANDYSAIPMPEGIHYFSSDVSKEYYGRILCEQVYSQGLLYNLIDILRVYEGKKCIWMESIATRLFLTLNGAKKFYANFDYQGVLVGELTLFFNGVEDVLLHQIVMNSNRFFSIESKRNLLTQYIWSLETDTSVLNDDRSFQDLFLKKMREIYWDLGYDTMDDNLIKKFMESRLGWTII